MSVKPRPSRPRHKPRPRSRPRLFLPPPQPTPQVSMLVKWEPTQLSMEELLRTHSLPLLVQCRTPVLQPADGGPVPVQLDKMMVLAEVRTARHLLARIVLFDQKTRTFNESVDSVVIPEDYEGHFLKLRSRTTKDKSHVKTLQTIAHDDTPAFLNLSDMVSFPAGPRSSKDRSRLIYTMGNVFLVDEPLPFDIAHGDETAGGPSGKRSGRQTLTPTNGAGRGNKGFMRCLDERGMPIMVPTDQVGEMVTVHRGGDSQSKLSVQSSEMIAKEQFPLLARFAYGKKEPRLTAFSKLLTLLDTFEETSVIACILDGPSMMLLEIPCSSSLQFQVALNQDELMHTSRIRHAVEVCRTRGRELARDIKFKYKFSHRVQETTRRMMRAKEGDLPSATVRTRLVFTESYVYI